MKLRIRAMREDKDLTQKQIATYLQCDQSLYSKYERQEREIPLHLVMQLAAYYNTSVDYLIGSPTSPLLTRAQNKRSLHKVTATTTHSHRYKIANARPYGRAFAFVAIFCIL